MSRIAHMLAAWRPRQEAWLAVARGLVAGDGPGIRALGSAISAPLACVVAGAALASIASSDGVDDTWTRITAQSFIRSEEHTSELQSLMRIPYAVFCLKKKN